MKSFLWSLSKPMFDPAFDTNQGTGRENCSVAPMTMPKASTVANMAPCTSVVGLPEDGAMLRPCRQSTWCHLPPHEGFGRRIAQNIHGVGDTVQKKSDKSFRTIWSYI